MNRYIMTFGAIIILIMTMLNLSHIKLSRNDIIQAICISQCINIIILFFDLSEFLTMLPMIIISGIYIYKKSSSLIFSFVFPLSSVILYVLFDYLLTNVIIYLFGIYPESIRKSYELYSLIYVLEFLALFSISKLMGVMFNKKIKILNLYINKKISVLIVISLILTIIIFYTNIIFEHNSLLKKEFIKINGLLFTCYFMLNLFNIYILFRSITKEMDFKNKQIEFENLQEYTSNLEKLYSDMRVFRHDYINILSSIIGFVEDKDMDGLRKHINEHIVPLSEGIELNNFKLGILKNVMIPEIKGIMSSKLIRAQELGIDTFIDIAEPIKEINMDVIDLGRVIGILLDNAIEAALECDKPSLKTAIIIKDASVLIVIINSIQKEVPIHKIYQKGFSTKGENRGLGLYNLKTITNKYNNVFIDTLIEDNEFKQLVQIGKGCMKSA